MPKTRITKKINSEKKTEMVKNYEINAIFRIIDETNIDKSK